MEEVLDMITGSRIKTTGAGRTDTGVHAKHFTAHFDSDHALFHQPENFLHKVNRVLPPDIAVNRIYRVLPEAHARFSALSRTYEYIVSLKKDPFGTGFSWYFPRHLDLVSLQQAAGKLSEFRDFTSFSKLHSNVKTNHCHIDLAEWRAEDGKLVFTVRADRFLRNMVRAMVGTMIEVGLGKITVDEFIKIAEARDRNKAGLSVPAQGLYLSHIAYPDCIRL